MIHRSTAKARRTAARGFTLLELIVVLLILGILAAIAIPTYNIVQGNALARSIETTAQAIARDANAIAASNGDGGQVTSAARNCFSVSPCAGADLGGTLQQAAAEALGEADESAFTNLAQLTGSTASGTWTSGSNGDVGIVMTSGSLVRCVVVSIDPTFKAVAGTAYELPSTGTITTDCDPAN